MFITTKTRNIAKHPCYSCCTIVKTLININTRQQTIINSNNHYTLVFQLIGLLLTDAKLSTSE